VHQVAIGLLSHIPTDTAELLLNLKDEHKDKTSDKINRLLQKCLTVKLRSNKVKEQVRKIISRS
jgi:hypothetical protein